MAEVKGETIVGPEWEARMTVKPRVNTSHCILFRAASLQPPPVDGVPLGLIEKGNTMPETNLQEPSRKQYEEDNQLMEPDWRDAPSRAVQRSGLDRVRDQNEDWERRHTPPNNAQ
jgi:hypothetical protein